MLLKIFPKDVAEELKSFAEKVSSYPAKVRFGDQGEAEAARIEAEPHFDQFKEKTRELLSRESCENFKWMLWREAWYAANTKKGIEDDAKSDKEAINDHYWKAIEEGKVSITLMTNVREMGFGAAWYATNTLSGYHDDAVRDKANLDAYYAKIHAEVNLPAINLFTDISKALNIFPIDVAEELKSFAEKVSSYPAKVRFGNQGEAEAARIEAEPHFDQFKEKTKGLLSRESCENFKCMLWREAWYAANTRKGIEDDANNDKEAIKEHYWKVIEQGEVSITLMTNVREMGFGAAWYATNALSGNHDDAVRDKANLVAYYAKIHAEVNLVAMNFFTEEAQILSEKPNIVANETLINNGDIQQTMAFKFSVTEGKTSSTSHKVGFSYGIETSFSAGFFDFAEAKYGLSFNFSDDHTFSESIATGTTKSYEFPLAVPPHTTYVAKGTVHEAQMNVPYELVFDFGGDKRSVRGIWKGVAVSSVTYKIDKQ